MLSKHSTGAPIPSKPYWLQSVATFQGLPASDLALLEKLLKPITVARGAYVVREDDDADALFIVVSGRFAVEIGGSLEPVTEIGQGATIGEIAFFAGGKRTATVRAIRESVVVRLTRAGFDQITSRAPAVWNAVAAILAARLAVETRKSTDLRKSVYGLMRAGPNPRTIAVIPAGPTPILPAFPMPSARLATSTRAR